MDNPSSSTPEDFPVTPRSARGDPGALAALIVRSATDSAIVTSDTNGVITSWSPGAEAVMGWTKPEAVGQSLDLFFTPEDVATGQPALVNVARTCGRLRHPAPRDASGDPAHALGQRGGPRRIDGERDGGGVLWHLRGDRSYARTWTAELAPRGIRVNILSPGPTETSMMAAVSDDNRAAILSRVPLGRFARLEEIAAAALFLAGSDLHVDGGMAQV